MLDTQIFDLERRIAGAIDQDVNSAIKAKLLLSIPAIAPFSAGMLMAEMPNWAE